MALIVEPSDDAAWMAARHHARQNPKARVVCLFPDDGHRYSETIYNDEYLWSENPWLPELTKAPREVIPSSRWRTGLVVSALEQAQPP